MISKRDAREFRIRNQYMLPWSPSASVSSSRAAEMIGTSQTTIRKLIEEGSIRGYKLRPHKKTSEYRISVESIAAYMRKVAEEFDLDLPSATRQP